MAASVGLAPLSLYTFYSMPFITITPEGACQASPDCERSLFKGPGAAITNGQNLGG